jgi:hypothetical protein
MKAAKMCSIGLFECNFECGSNASRSSLLNRESLFNETSKVRMQFIKARKFKEWRASRAWCEDLQKCLNNADVKHVDVRKESVDCSGQHSRDTNTPEYTK